MQSKRSFHNFDDSGFTVVEVLVGSLLGLIVLSLCLGTALSNRGFFGRDATRVRLVQNLRGALDLVAADGRIAGENLGTSFPAVEVTDGTAGATDTLTLRRNMVDEVLKLCQPINAGDSVSQLFFAIPGVVPGCIYSSNTHNYNAWRAYRTANTGTVDAFIYDVVGKNGEFFKMNGEGDDNTHYWVTRTAGAFAHSYPVASSSIYILEEWRYARQGDLLQIIQNQDNTKPYNVSFGITDFQVAVFMQSGTQQAAFSRTDAWPQIARIQVQLSAEDHYAGEVISRSMTGQFFPRNVLSN